MNKYSLNNIPEITIKYVNKEGKNKNAHFDCVEDYHFYVSNTEKNLGFTFRFAGNDFWNGFRKELMNGTVESFTVSMKGSRVNDDMKGTETYWYLKNEVFDKCSVSYGSANDTLVRVNCHSCSECCCDCDCE